MNLVKKALVWVLVGSFCFAAALGIAVVIDYSQGGKQDHWDDLAGVAAANPPTPTVDNFNPVDVVRPFPPITDFPVVSADEAAEKVRDAELVLGVVVNDEARAYPINMLTGPSREILNDQLGGRAIAATW